MKKWLAMNDTMSLDKALDEVVFSLLEAIVEEVDCIVEPLGFKHSSEPSKVDWSIRQSYVNEDDSDCLLIVEFFDLSDIIVRIDCERKMTRKLEVKYSSVYSRRRIIERAAKDVANFFAHP